MWIFESQVVYLPCSMVTKTFAVDYANGNCTGVVAAVAEWLYHKQVLPGQSNICKWHDCWTTENNTTSISSQAWTDEKFPQAQIAPLQ